MPLQNDSARRFHTTSTEAYNTTVLQALRDLEETDIPITLVLAMKFVYEWMYFVVVRDLLVCFRK